MGHGDRSDTLYALIALFAATQELSVSGHSRLGALVSQIRATVP